MSGRKPREEEIERRRVARVVGPLRMQNGGYHCRLHGALILDPLDDVWRCEGMVWRAGQAVACGARVTIEVEEL